MIGKTYLLQEIFYIESYYEDYTTFITMEDAGKALAIVKALNEFAKEYTYINDIVGHFINDKDKIISKIIEIVGDKNEANLLVDKIIDLGTPSDPFNVKWDDEYEQLFRVKEVTSLK